MALDLGDDMPDFDVVLQQRLDLAAGGEDRIERIFQGTGFVRGLMGWVLSFFFEAAEGIESSLPVGALGADSVASADGVVELGLPVRRTLLF